jgi:hypothetical protein
MSFPVTAQKLLQGAILLAERIHADIEEFE